MPYLALSALAAAASLSASASARLPSSASKREASEALSFVTEDSLDSSEAVLDEACMYCSAAVRSRSCAAASWMVACCNRSERLRSTRSLAPGASFRLACGRLRERSIKIEILLR